MMPDEAEAAMKAGLAHSLMLDYWVAEDNIEVLCPAILGYLGTDAPFWPDGQCTFLKKNRCEIHDSGFKPLQCRMAKGCTGEGTDKKDFVKIWDTDPARALISKWKTMVSHES